MSEAIYDTEEYISKVMRIEGCSRKEAEKLIREFKRIDRTRADIKSSLASSDRLKAYRQSWKERGMCQCCGMSDERTQNGYSTCGRCNEYRKAYYQKHKAELREKRRIKNGSKRKNN